MTQTKIFALFILLTLTLVWSCKKDEDTEAPKINLISPTNCDTIIQGNFISFEAQLTDNKELAQYSIDIVENFDHVTYGSSDQGCPQESEKDPVNPFIFVSAHDIPAGQTEFTVEQNIIVPESVDDGDYMLVVTVQDTKGLRTYYTISLKFISPDDINP